MRTFKSTWLKSALLSQPTDVIRAVEAARGRCVIVTEVPAGMEVNRAAVEALGLPRSVSVIGGGLWWDGSFHAARFESVPLIVCARHFGTARSATRRILAACLGRHGDPNVSAFKLRDLVRSGD